MTRTRSIGDRSDWGDKTPGAETEDGEDADVQSNGRTPGAPSRQWSIFQDDNDANGHADGGEQPKQRGREEDEQDAAINNYVADQIARIKSNESHEFSEELAASTDGGNDEL